MSENNNIFENDLLMTAILEGGQEEVPGRVWDAVSDRLDEAAAVRNGSRSVTLWWRRAGIAVAAMAAAAAGILVLNRPESADIIPAASQSDMIAVVQPEVIMNEEVEELIQESSIVSKTSGAKLLAYAPEIVRTSEPAEMTSAIESAADADFVAEQVASPKEASDNHTERKSSAASEEKVYFPEVWEDDEPQRKGLKTAFTVSGITGATSSRNSAGTGINRAPALTLTPTQTGIREKANNARYGLPVSVGAGVKFDFTPRWSLGVGLNYTCLTRTFDGTYSHVNEAGIVDNVVNSDIRNSQHYLGIPVNAYFNILDSKHVNFYTYAGGAVEKCISDKYNVLSSNTIHKEPAKGVQLSANLGLGAEFMLGQHVGLYIDPSVRYYFDCNQPKSIRTDQPLMFGVELGCRFRL